MPKPTPVPIYVYKIIDAPPPDPIPEEYPLSDLDRQDGFVHLSTSWQAPKTADLFFGHTNNIWLIKLRLGRFADDARWDDVPGVDGCPHLYGNFGRADVEAVRRYRRAEGLEWSQAIARQEEGEGKFLD